MFIPIYIYIYPFISQHYIGNTHYNWGVNMIYPFSQAFCPNGTSKSRTLPDSYACAEAKSLGAFWFLGPSVLWWLGGEWFHGDNRGPLRSTYLFFVGSVVSLLKEAGSMWVGSPIVCWCAPRSSSLWSLFIWRPIFPDAHDIPDPSISQKKIP
jgi:hypothetical protein